jgi:hypothetical protein
VERGNRPACAYRPTPRIAAYKKESDRTHPDVEKKSGGTQRHTQKGRPGAPASANGKEIAHCWTEHDKRLALSQVALQGGNVRRAATALKKQGTPIPRRTLQDWKANEPELYAEGMREVLPLVNAGIADELTESIRLDLANHRKGAARLNKEIGDPELIPPRDRSKAIRDSAVSAAVGIDKRQLLTNQPTEIKRHRVRPRSFGTWRHKALIGSGS